METIPTYQTVSENEHSIVSLLGGECLEQAITIQGKLKTLFGDAIWLQQPPSLHITLMEIICDVDYGNLSRAALFEEWYENYNSITRDVLSEISPFDLIFDELLVSQRAIIIKTRESKELNAIREHLLSNIALPPHTKNPPDITHYTLARFTKALDLEGVTDRVKDLTIAAPQHITEFSLVKDLGPPLFNGQPMEHYILSG